MLTELEYKKYVDEHIMLNLDPEMKDIKPKEMDYNSDLEEFMQLHNSVIAGCYARLHEIAAIPNYKDNAELVALRYGYEEFSHMMSNDIEIR
jgi:hypothetical protein